MLYRVYRGGGRRSVLNVWAPCAREACIEAAKKYGGHWNDYDCEPGVSNGGDRIAADLTMLHDPAESGDYGNDFSAVDELDRIVDRWNEACA